MASVDSPGNNSEQPETLLEFPCSFPVKAMGLNDDGFEALVTKIILAHAEVFSGTSITSNRSSSGKYLSVTVTINATSKVQLDSIYQDLTDNGQVLLAL